MLGGSCDEAAAGSELHAVLMGGFLESVLVVQDCWFEIGRREETARGCPLGRRLAGGLAPLAGLRGDEALLLFRSHLLHLDSPVAAHFYPLRLNSHSNLHQVLLPLRSLFRTPPYSQNAPEEQVSPATRRSRTAQLTLQLSPLAEAAVAEKKTLLGRPSNNLQIGIVGVPNVGKSSLFNILTQCGESRWL